MEVKNKIDDCRYAVKRIRLQEQLNTVQYDRVLREVKALAKLDHHGIVRYFNAWTEYPPTDWQEERDKEFNIHDCTDSGESSDLEYSESTKSQEYSSKRKKSIANFDNTSQSKQRVSSINLKMKLNQNPFNLPEDDLLDYENPSKNSSSATSDSQGHSSSETGENSSDDTSVTPLHISANYNLNVHHDNEENDQDDFSVVFKIPDNDTASKKTDSNKFDELGPSKHFSEDDTFSVVKCSSEHAECYAKLKSLNEELTCQFKVEIFHILSTYFFHDAEITGIPVTERSDWKNALNEWGIDNKMSLQRWLICILNLLRSSNDFMLFLPIINLCYILAAVNKSLSDIESIKNWINISNGFSLHQGTYIPKKQAVQFKSKSTCIERPLPTSSKSKASTKSSKDFPQGYLYIQMQLCQRESLRDWLDLNCDGRDYERVMDMFDQIVEAVHYVHSCGLMHRDLKPSNIYFSLEGDIKVGDFGLATSSEIHEASVIHTRQSFSHTSDIGTEIYMSPEQKLRDYDNKTDIYSLGLILFELLVPFKTAVERYKLLPLVRQHQFPKSFTEQYPKESELVRRLLEEDPASRPNTKEIGRSLSLIKSGMIP